MNVDHKAAVLSESVGGQGRKQETYKRGSDRLIDTFECQHIIAQVLECSLFIEKRALDRQELGAWVFPKKMIQEIYES